MAHASVMGRRVVFSEVVGEIVGTASPVDQKLIILDAIFDPIKTHVDGFGATLLHSIISDAGGTGIVGLDGSGRLGMVR
jgi:hypothetical protein